jgi:hypothetical protein
LVAEYHIEHHRVDRPEVDVTKDRRAFAYDLTDVDEAISRIKRDRDYAEGDEVFLVHHDGYRERLRIT